MSHLTALPRSPYDTWRWAEELFGARDYLGAATTLEQLLEHPEVDPQDLPQVRELLARAYYHSARLERAIDATREALEHEPGNAYLLLLLGRSLERAGHDDEAAAYLRMARAADVA